MASVHHPAAREPDLAGHRQRRPGARVQAAPTRELASGRGVNHLTAARVYRKLAELAM